ncbi:MAG: carbohydrate deacetylase [Planctomycetaceae bacterium]
MILHADDLGYSDLVNEGIIQGFTHGLLTSTSVLTNANACQRALAAWKEMCSRRHCEALPSTAARRRLGDTGEPFDLGVHLNLTQGRPLTGRAFPRRLLDSEGRFFDVFALAPRLLACSRAHTQAIRDELGAQIEVVLEQGLVPTHLNGHQYVELLPIVAALIPELLARYRIATVRVAWERHLSRTALGATRDPLQWGLAQVKRMFAFRFLLRMARSGAAYTGAYFGTAHAGRIDLPLLRLFLERAAGQTVEIGLHPGGGYSGSVAAATAPESWADPLAEGRSRELAMLTSHELVDVLAGRGWRLGRLQALPSSMPSQSAAA